MLMSILLVLLSAAMASIIIRMSNKSTLLWRLVCIVMESRLFKTIWSKEHLVLTLITSSHRIIATVKLSLVWLDHWRFSYSNWDIWWDTKPCILTIRRTLCIMAFNRAVDQSLCNFILISSTICLLNSASISSIFHLILLHLLLLSIEILVCASIIRHVKIFNARWPLSLSVSHRELVSLIWRIRPNRTMRLEWSLMVQLLSLVARVTKLARSIS
jgi:hypothetical protein